MSVSESTQWERLLGLFIDRDHPNISPSWLLLTVAIAACQPLCTSAPFSSWPSFPQLGSWKPGVDGLDGTRIQLHINMSEESHQHHYQINWNVFLVKCRRRKVMLWHWRLHHASTIFNLFAPFWWEDLTVCLFKLSSHSASLEHPCLLSSHSWPPVCPRSAGCSNLPCRSSSYWHTVPLFPSQNPPKSHLSAMAFLWDSEWYSRPANNGWGGYDFCFSSRAVLSWWHNIRSQNHCRLSSYSRRAVDLQDSWSSERSLRPCNGTGLDPRLLDLHDLHALEHQWHRTT